jgi:ribosomal protein L10
MSLRGKAVVLMGKNTMMRKAIRGHLENNPALEKSVSASAALPSLPVVRLPLPGAE